jgi:hypothetical protein
MDPASSVLRWDFTILRNGFTRFYSTKLLEMGMEIEAKKQVKEVMIETENDRQVKPRWREQK